MKQGYVVLPSADADLDNQADYLEENANIDTALRFYDAAELTFAFLASTPEAGALRESANPALAGLRHWRIKGFEKHRIFYRTTEQGVEIVRVLHVHRDIEAAFSERSGGQWAGKVEIADDFDCLPNDIAAVFGMPPKDEGSD